MPLLVVVGLAGWHCSVDDVVAVAGRLALPHLADRHAGVVTAHGVADAWEHGDPLRALCRPVEPGGAVAAFVRDYADGMQLIRLFWDVAAELDPEPAPLDEGTRFPLCRPDALAAAFRGGRPR